VRTSPYPVILFGMLVTAPSVQAQGYPAEMVITLPEVEVRSGPTKEYQPTNKLKYGDRVLVLRESEKQPGWFAIKPPQGSFSWIKDKYVKQTDPRTGIVVEEGAALMPGSSVSNKAPNVESVKVPLGSIVTIVDKGKTADGVVWYPVQPWPTEVRWIPGEAVQNRTFANNNNANINGPAAAAFTGNPLISQADQAYVTGDVEKAKQLYKDAAEKTADYTQKIYCYNRLASLSQSSWNPAQAPGNPAQMAQGSPWPPAQAASFSQNNPAGRNVAYPPQWSKVGVLRRAPFDKDGQPTYVLEDPRSKGVLYYVNCQPGLTLRDYVGKTIAVYGTLNYRSDDYLRTHYMMATHVALY
jgi:uncharacterized protein YgiM (DUF1202 family)